MKSHWVEHKGKRVFVAEYTHFGMDSRSLQKEADEIIAALVQEPPDSVLAISNVEGTTASMEIIRVLSSILPHTNPFVHKRAAIGVSGIRWYFIDTFNQLTGKAPIKSFPTLEEALDWIVKD